MKKLIVSKKIRNDWGTLTHFCRKNNIQINTFKQVLYGYGKSKKITDLLIKSGYIKTEKDLER